MHSCNVCQLAGSVGSWKGPRESWIDSWLHPTSMLRRAGPLLHARSLTTAPKPQISQRSAVDLALIALTGIGISGFLLFSSNRARPDESTMEGKRGVFTVPVVNQ